GALPARPARRVRGRGAGPAGLPADLGARGHDRHHAGRGAPPVAPGRLPGHGARPADDVPQPDANGRALCRGGRVRSPAEAPMNAPDWTVRRLHRLDDAQVDGLADVLKMLVHRRARRRGLGAALMRAAEATARGCGKNLLVLDAVTDGDAARLYERLGWVRVGVIPGYALMPRGGLCATTFYYRSL